jgi:hypothetical protein
LLSLLEIFWFGADFVFPTHYHPERVCHSTLPIFHNNHFASSQNQYINTRTSHQQWQEAKARVSVERAAARRNRLQRVRNRIAQRLAYRSVTLCNSSSVVCIVLEPICAPHIPTFGPCERSTRHHSTFSLNRSAPPYNLDDRCLQHGTISKQSILITSIKRRTST